MKKGIVVLIAFLTIGLVGVNSLQGELPEDAHENNSLPQVVKSIKFHRNYNLAGELIPNTTDAYERLDREMTKNAYWHSSSIMMQKLANKYFPIIEPILAEEGVPNDFKYLAVAESGLRNLVSPAKAKGLWQFMKLSGKEYKLEINKEVDERYHVEKSTRAAAKYLKALKTKFGTWTNAAAAYNMGMTAFNKSRKNQRETDYYNMNLSDETNRYVFRIIAIKEIMQNPETYGFYLDNEDKYSPDEDYYNIKIDKTIPNIGDFAHDHGTTYREIKKLNPWLRSTSLTVKNNTYFIKIPRNSPK